MKFFKPEDFKSTAHYHLTKDELMNDLVRSYASDLANAKLEREGKTVYFVPETEKCWSQWLENVPTGVATKRAFLINIEPISKCEHPKEKVSGFHYSQGDFVTAQYQCECGARVEPESFKEYK